MWMTELATNTMTAERRMGIRSEGSGTIDPPTQME
jgi:hypothetical protein